MAAVKAEKWTDVRMECAKAVIEGTKKLYGSEEYADLEIVCGARTFKVHKAVICPRSDFFRAACRKDAFKEGKEGVITLCSEAESGTGDDPEIIGLMIEFLYCSDYKATTVTTHANRTASTHARVYAAADKFQIPSLKSTALVKLKEFLNSSVAPIYDLVTTIRIIFTSIPESSSVGIHFYMRQKLVEMPFAILEHKDIRAAIQSHETLAYDLLLLSRVHHSR